jgi:hypothetical protein
MENSIKYVKCIMEFESHDMPEKEEFEKIWNGRCGLWAMKNN